MKLKKILAIAGLGLSIAGMASCGPKNTEDNGGQGYVATEQVTVTLNYGYDTPNEEVKFTKGIYYYPSSPKRTGYEFIGWYVDEELSKAYDDTKILEADTTLYAKWVEVTHTQNIVVTFTVDGQKVAEETAEEGTVALPEEPSKTGYEFAGWYDGDTKFVNGNITASLNLVAKFNPIKFTLSIEKDGGVSSEAIPELLEYDTNYILPTLTKKNYIFGGYEDENGVKYQAGSSINVKADISLTALWTFDATNANLDSSIQFSKALGSYESATLTWNKVQDVEGYNVYLKKENASFTKLTDKNFYIDEKSNVEYLYLFGLEPASYEVKVVPTVADTEFDDNSQTATINVEAYDRSGYAHFNYTEGVGAYKDNGTLKDNAIVIYVTDKNKNTVTLTYGGKTVTGIGNILNSVGQECGEPDHVGQCKKVSDGKTYYGKANTNQGILLDLAQNNIPLVVRFVGCVSNSGKYEPTTFDAKTTSLIEGLTAYSSVDYGGSTDDNGHMARMKSAKNITFEGVGDDAVIDGWGFHLICETAYKEYAKNFEVRNLTFINTPEDAIGMEGQEQESTLTITASVERCWVHHNTFISPKISNPAEGDKSEGDGSCDFKRGRYFTCSYNYFQECHKTNLIGSSKTSVQFNMSYHHNIWYNCAARQPLARRGNIHFYNNLIIGTTDTVSSLRANSYMFAEANYYMGCSRPVEYKDEQGVGVCKSYNNILVGCFNDYSATVVENREEEVASNCKDNEISYVNFDTNSELFYYDSVNNKSNCYITDASTARIECLAKSGSNYRTVANKCKLGTSSKVTTTASSATVTGETSLTIGKGKNVLKVFTVTSPVTVTIAATASAGFDNGYLLKMDGTLVLKLKASAQTAILENGEYVVVSSVAFTANGKNDKETTISECTFAPYSSDELNQKMIASYNAAANQIPATITYTDNCYNSIKAALDIYNTLGELKSQVDGTKVANALSQYKSLGETTVTELITNIGTVTADSGDAIITARTAYNALKEKFSDANISNLDVLVAAEEAYKNYAVSGTIALINEIGTVTLESKEKIEKAEASYAALSNEQKQQVTNYLTLTSARTTYNSLKAVDDVEKLITNVDLTSAESMQAVLTAYNALSNAEKDSVSNKSQIAVIKANLVKVKIQALPENVTRADLANVNAIKALYDELDETSKALVTNYSVLEQAIAKLSQLPTESVELTVSESDLVITGATTMSGTVGKTTTICGITKVKYSSPSQIVINATKGDAAVSFKISYSTDGANWTEIGTQQPKSNNKAQDLTYTANIEGEVYIKIEIISTKDGKTGTVSSIKIKCYQ